MKTIFEKTPDFFRIYVRIPRFVIQRQFSEKKNERRLGQMMAIFYGFCSFRENDFISNGKRLILRRGEWVTSYEQLEQMTDSSQTSIRYILKLLREEGSIEISSRGKMLNIYLTHFEEMDQQMINERKEQRVQTRKTQTGKGSASSIRGGCRTKTATVVAESTPEQLQAISENAELLKRPDLNAFKRRAGKAKEAEGSAGKRKGSAGKRLTAAPGSEINHTNKQTNTTSSPKCPKENAGN